MVRSFQYKDIHFKKDDHSDGLVVTGEIANKSGRNYQSVVFRVIVYTKSIAIGSENITINGFLNGQTRSFSKKIEDLVYIKVAKDITNCEIYPTGGY